MIRISLVGVLALGGAAQLYFRGPSSVQVEGTVTAIEQRCQVAYQGHDGDFMDCAAAQARLGRSENPRSGHLTERPFVTYTYRSPVNGHTYSNTVRETDNQIRENLRPGMQLIIYADTRYPERSTPGISG